MDPITHGALGAATAQLVLFKKNKQNAWIVGALAAMAPDLDIFIRSDTNPMLQLLYHRNFTHAISFIPLGAILVTLGLMIFKRFRKDWPGTFLAAFIGFSTHGLLDACTSYGTMLFWPFSDARISWDLIAIIDPFFTFPIILGLTWTIVNNNRLGTIIGLLLAGSFLLFNSYQHSRAISASLSYGKQQNLQITRLRSFPFLLSSTYWRTAIDSNQQFYLADVHTPLSSNTKVKALGNYPKFLSTELPNYVKESPSLLQDFKIFNWFTEDSLILAGESPLTLVDGRYLIGEHPLIALWGIQFLPGKTHVDSLGFIKLEAKNGT
ncbi:MAG: metal-dependent hydrolase [Tatlockia sp.]|nr:metal-dependent hydrolase [Tatlockia sp.]